MPTITTEIDIAAPPSDICKVVSHGCRRKLPSENLRSRRRLRHSILTRIKFLDFASYPEWSKAFIKSIQVTAGDGTNVKPGDTLKVDLEASKFAPVVQVCSTPTFRVQCRTNPDTLECSKSQGLTDAFLDQHAGRVEMVRQSPRHPCRSA